MLKKWGLGVTVLLAGVFLLLPETGTVLKKNYIIIISSNVPMSHFHKARPDLAPGDYVGYVSRAFDTQSTLKELGVQPLGNDMLYSKIKKLVDLPGLKQFPAPNKIRVKREWMDRVGVLYLKLNSKIKDRNDVRLKYMRKKYFYRLILKESDFKAYDL